MTTLRAATPLDAAAIAHVHVQSWKTTYAGILPAPFLDALNENDRLLQWQQWLTLDIPVFVAAEANAESDGHILGFISGGPLREPIPAFDAELFAIYLLEPAQKSGIGTALLRQLAATLRSKSLTSLIVWVLEQNPSKSFYLKSGAQLITSKEIELAGITLTEQAYGWPTLNAIR